MKRLLVMRHAKSDWDAGAPDHERPLSKRGVRAAETMGRVLALMEEQPDLVYSSTATRAHTTALRAAESGGWDTPVETYPDLYHASVRRTLEVALRAPDDVQSLMVVGHQPTWANLVDHLTGSAVAVKTATVVGIDLYLSSWSGAPQARGEIAYVLQPRLFTDGSWGGRLEGTN